MKECMLGRVLPTWIRDRTTWYGYVTAMAHSLAAPEQRMYSVLVCLARQPDSFRELSKGRTRLMLSSANEVPDFRRATSLLHFLSSS